MAYATSDDVGDDIATRLLVVNERLDAGAHLIASAGVPSRRHRASAGGPHVCAGDLVAVALDEPAQGRQAAGDDVVPIMLERYAQLWLAGILGAGIMAAVMASDSQILALSTMFTEDVFAFYGGKTRFGEHVQVQTGRLFVVVLTLIAYAVGRGGSAPDVRG